MNVQHEAMTPNNITTRAARPGMSRKANVARLILVVFLLFGIGMELSADPPEYKVFRNDPMRDFAFWPPWPQYNTHLRVCQGQAQLFTIVPLNLGKKPSSSWVLEIDFPEGVSLMDTNGRMGSFEKPIVSQPKVVTRNGKKYLRQSIRSRNVNPSTPRGKCVKYPQRGGQWELCVLRAQPDVPLGTVKAYWRENVPPIGKFGPWKEIVIEVLPRAVGNPKSGLEIEMSTSWFPVLTKEEQEALIETWAEVGITAVDTHPPFARFQKKGIKALVHINHPLITCWNQDPSRAYMNASGVRCGGWACPTQFVDPQGRAFLRKKLKEYLAGKPDGVFYIGENTPHCYCPKCVQGFRAYAKIPESQPLDAKTLNSKYKKAWVTFHCRQVAQAAVATKETLHTLNPKIKLWTYSYPQGALGRKFGVDWKFMADGTDYALIPWGVGKETRELIGNKAKILARVFVVPIPVEYSHYFGDDTIVPYDRLLPSLREYVRASNGNGLRIFYWMGVEGGWYTAIAQISNENK